MSPGGPGDEPHPQEPANRQRVSAEGTDMTTTTLTRPRRGGGSDRLGGIAGLLVPAACAAAVISTALSGPNLRQGLFPWAAASGVALAGLTTATLARRHEHVWGRLRRAVVRATTWGLFGVATFFVALGTEDLVNQALGTSRVLSASELITGIGTLLASLLATVVVPVGLVLVGVFTVRARVLDRLGRAATCAIGPVLVLGALLTGTTDATWISATWPLLLGLCWAALGTSLIRAGGQR
jgi:hypothetical protein